MSSISAGTTINTGLTYTSDTTGTLQIKTGAGAVTAIAIDTSQNVSIGNTTPTSGYRLTLTGGTGLNIANTGATDNSVVKYSNSGKNWYAGLRGDTSNAWALADDTAFQLMVDTTGLLKFNSGYGSVATAYGCRAWANHIGTGTGTVFNGKGGFSSVAKTSAGNFDYNFTTAMPDANYAVQVNSWQSVSVIGVGFNIYSLSTTSFHVAYSENNVGTNPNAGYVSVFR